MQTPRHGFPITALALGFSLLACSKDASGPSGDNPGTIDPAENVTAAIEAVRIAAATVVKTTAPAATASAAAPIINNLSAEFVQIDQGGVYELRLPVRDVQGDVASVIVGADGATSHLVVPVGAIEPNTVTELTLTLTFPESIRPGIVPLRISIQDAASNVASYKALPVVIGAPIPGALASLIVGRWRLTQVVGLPQSAVGHDLVLDAQGGAIDVNGAEYTYEADAATTRLTFSTGVVYDIVALNKTTLILNEIGGFGRFGSFKRQPDP